MLEMVNPYLFNIIASFILCLSVEDVSEEEQSEEEEDERENGNHIPTGEGGPINPDTRWLISVFYFMAFSFFIKSWLLCRPVDLLYVYFSWKAAIG